MWLTLSWEMNMTGQRFKKTLKQVESLLRIKRAYLENGGSMKALILWLVTSDAFLFRKIDFEG